MNTTATVSPPDTSSIRPFSSSLEAKNIYNVNDFQTLAKEHLSKELYEYLASGTDDEQTLRENQAAFKGWYLRPRILRSVGKLSTQTELLGHRLSMPVFVSPAGVHALCHPQLGECVTAHVCGTMNIPFGLSQHATRSIEDVAQFSPHTNKWYQSYILKDRSLTLQLVHRAIDAGYQAIVLTVDSVRFGYREADARNGFNALPPPHRLVNYDYPPIPPPPPEQQQQQQHPSAPSGLDATYNSATKPSWDQNSEAMFDPNVTWEDVRWMKEEGCCHHRRRGNHNYIDDNHNDGDDDDDHDNKNGQPHQQVPLILKGIMTAEDAELAVLAGADAIIVSNHGGRQLDGALSTIDVLPEIAQAVAGRIPILLDSGVRRGTDILKALALGATAVGIGKPIFFALAVGGEDAVQYLLTMLKTELEAAMALCGVETISDIAPHLVTRHPHASVLPFVRSSL